MLKFNSDSDRSPFNSDMNNWQPRLGLAWAVDNKTSVRAGYGLFYQLSRATVFGHTGAGFNVNSTSNSSLDSNATLYAKLNNPYPDGMLLPPGSSQGDKTYHRAGRRHHPRLQQPEPRVPLLELLDTAGNWMAVSGGSELHGQPRNSPVPAGHHPVAARPELLVDGPHDPDVSR